MHFFVNPAKAAMVGISQRPVPVDEPVARRADSKLPGKASTRSQRIPELDEHPGGVFGRIRSIDAVVQVNLDFAPPRVAVLGQSIDQIRIAIFSGIKIRVAQGPAIMIAPALDCHGILAAPSLYPALLLSCTHWRPGSGTTIHRLKMIGNAND